MSQNLHSIQPQPRATVPAVTEAAPIYYGILTDQGQALLAAAIASGTPLPLTAMAAGDGGGQPVTPLAEMTELVNEVHRAPLNQLFVDPTVPNQIVAEMVMAETVGGFWIRELGLFAESGELFAVCNTPDSYKPVLAEGAGRSLLTRMILIVSDTAAVELIINPDTVMASRAYVDAKLAEHAASRDHPAAIEGAQGMIPLATQAMVDEGTDHTSAVTPQTAGITFARKTHSHTPQEAGAAPLEHEHEIDDVLWLQEALDEKADVAHQHEIDDVSGLSTELDGKQPLDAMLTALAALVTAADKLLYFTGADAPALATFTAFARTLLDDANAGDMLTTLGVSAFIQGLLNDADEATARATLGVTSYNLKGKTGPAPAAGSDVLEYFRTNPSIVFRTFGSGLESAPSGFSYGPMFFQLHGEADGVATYGALTAIDVTDRQMWTNTLNNGTWTGWTQNYTTAHKPTAADVGALPASGKTVTVSASDPLILSGTSPAIKFVETDTGKAYYIIVDASGIRMNEDSSTGINAWQYDAATNLMRFAATPAAGDNSTNAATTAFVMANAARLSHSHTAAQGNSDIVAGSTNVVGAPLAAQCVNMNSLTQGSKVAGSNLRAVAMDVGNWDVATTGQPGTWMLQGHNDSGRDMMSLYIRQNDPLIRAETSIIDIHWGDAEHSFIDMIVDGIPFTASKADPQENGRWLFAMARDGEFGPIAEYVPPTPEEVATLEYPKIRQSELAHAIAQYQHWEMMGIPEQANAWRDYYQAIYALEQAPEWPKSVQWPPRPS